MKLEDPSDEEIVRFYKNLLGSSPVHSTSNIDSLRSALPKRLTEAQQSELAREVSASEIREVLFSLKDNKAPGPDGFNALFYKKAWGIVGHTVIEAIKDFFKSGNLLKEINSTAVTLIPQTRLRLKILGRSLAAIPFTSALQRFWPIESS